MQVKKRIFIPLLASLGYYLSSLYMNLIPCKVSPNITNPNFKWALCSLNPDSFASETMKTLFFGIFPKMTDAILTVFVGTFLILFLFFTLFANKRNQKHERR